MLAVACCATGATAGAVYVRLAGRRGWPWASLVVGAAWCPLSWAAVRVANISAPVGVSIGLMLLGLISGRAGVAALGCYLGAVLKFATLPLVAIPLLLGRFRAFAACAATGVLATAGVVLITGPDLWEEYRVLFPALGVPNGRPINMSLLGFLNHAVPPSFLPGAHAARTVALVGAVAVIFGGLFRNRGTDDPRGGSGRRLGPAGVVPGLRPDHPEPLLDLPGAAVGLLSGGVPDRVGGPGRGMRRDRGHVRAGRRQRPGGPAPDRLPPALDGVRGNGLRRLAAVHPDPGGAAARR